MSQRLTITKEVFRFKKALITSATPTLWGETFYPSLTTTIATEGGKVREEKSAGKERGGGGEMPDKQATRKKPKGYPSHLACGYAALALEEREITPRWSDNKLLFNYVLKALKAL